MRILMLSQFYPPVIGGEERHVRNLGMALIDRGLQVAVATLGTHGRFGVETQDGINVHRLRSAAQRLSVLHSDPERPHVAPFPDLELVGGLRRVIEAERPDVVHAHNWIVNSVLPLKRRSHWKLVLTLHDYSHVCATKRLMYSDMPCAGPGVVKCLRCAGRQYGPLLGPPTTLAAWTMRHVKGRSVDRVIVVSRAVAEGNRLTQTRLPFEVIPNFIPDALLESGQRPRDVDQHDSRIPDGPFILFVGDLTRDKGVHVLLEAYERLERRPPLLLMGRRCPDTPTRLPAGAVILENCPHSLVMTALQQCTAAVAPSIFPDPCPTVVIEAMAVGRALLATRAGGITDMVQDGESGLLVDPDDPNQIGDALRRLLDERALRERLGAAARERAKWFTAGVAVDRIVGVYESLVTRPAA